VPTEQRSAVIVGAGPAGLVAGIELKRRGVTDVLVVEREPLPGGVPRWCAHTGFGARDLGRLLTGPAYARRYARAALAAGVEIRLSTTVTGWCGPRTIATTSPAGLVEIEAGAVLLATGCREQPRAARLVAGSRAPGTFTTGSLQRFVHEHHLPVGRTAVVVGAELVSFSALLTLRHAGVRCVALITELPRHQVYFPYSLALWLWTELLEPASVRTGVRLVHIHGRQRVEAVELQHLASGQVETVACDTVVFTGGWRPETELARYAGIGHDIGTRGPRADQHMRTSQPGVFAAGNVLHGAHTASQCALEGRAAARGMVRYLSERVWPRQRLPIEVAAPVNWIFPNELSFPVADRPAAAFGFRVAGFYRSASVAVAQAGQRLHTQTYRLLRPNDTVRLSGAWVKTVRQEAGPVQLLLEP
jgi:thioredoxin reductase